MTAFTEGVTDCVSAMQAGVVCISPVTTRFRKQDVPRLLELTRGVRRIVVCNDSEKNGAGEAGARETAAALWAEGRNVHLALIPRPEGKDKIDVNELVATRGPDALREVLAAAKPYPDYLLDRIPPDAPKEELDGLLEPVLEALVGCSAIKADAVLDAIAAKFALRRRPLAARLKALAAKRRIEAVAGRPPAATVPEIRVSGRQLRDIVADAGHVLVTSNARRLRAAAAGAVEPCDAPLFVRGNALARLERAESGGAGLLDASETVVFGYLLREADWVQVTEHGKQPVFPPKDVPRDLVAFPPAGLPTIDTVTATPVFGRDGRLIVEPGCHEADRVWLDRDPALQVGEIPACPSADEVATARSLFLDDLLVDFPFVGPSDRAHLMAAILLPFVRRMIDGCTPLHVVESPSPGSGKGLLCNIVAAIVTGRPCDCRTIPESEEETRKTFTAELIKGRPIVLLDNARESATLTSAALAAVLTATSWTDRLLGVSRTVTLPNTALWMLTGNNPKLSKDLARRSIRIRIDPKQDRAWRRTGFKHDPLLSWVKANRDDLVRAALVAVRAWIAAGRPPGRERLGSFEHWSAVLGGVLAVTGIDGFLGNLEELYANADVDGAMWREFVQAWWEARGPTETYVSDLHGLCEKQDLMVPVRGEGSARSQQSRLGRALQGARDRAFGDLQITLASRDRKGKAVYALKCLGGGSPAGGDETDATGGVDPW